MTSPDFYKMGIYILLASSLFIASGCSSVKTNSLGIASETAMAEEKCTGMMVNKASGCTEDSQPSSLSAFKPVEPSQFTEQLQLLDEVLQPDLNLKNAAAVTPNEAATPKADATGTKSGEAVILSTPGSYFAIQLAALAELGETEAFRNQYPIVDLLQARLESNDQLWFVLLAGVHDSYSAAKLAADALLMEHPGLSPWIRPVKGLHQAITRIEQNNF